MNVSNIDKHVLFVISSLAGGGAERVLTYIANSMIERGITVKILKTSTKTNENYGLNKKIQVIQLPKIDKNKVAKAYYMIRNIRRVFLKHKGYVVISFLSDNNMLSILASIGLGNKVIISERNDPSKNCGNRVLRSVRNVLYRLADWNVFQTEEAKKYFSKSIQKRSSIIPNPVILDNKYKYNEENSQKRIIAVGRLTLQKNYAMLIDAYRLFWTKHPEYSLQIFGDGPMKEDIISLIEEYNLSEFIQIHGFTNTIYDEMLKSKIYVSSSDYEGISNTMLEAMAMGVPTVVTDCPIGGARLVIEDGINGFLVPVGDYRNMADKLCLLAEYEEIREKFSDRSQSIKDKFSIENICAMWEKII